DANGCLDPQDCDVGVTDMPLPDALTIYPNPANEYLNLKIEQGSGTYTVFLLDAMGRLVQHETHSGIGTHTLNLSGLAPGIYYCRVVQGGEVVGVEKVVKTPL
ncbi:MAG: T9SS type A sorting domain-containing protein, partial [Bacteroidetes bacterium]|nr:T9SS type A sorting domain-containing protein [Bacteroidota bacterium]